MFLLKTSPQPLAARLQTITRRQPAKAQVSSCRIAAGITGPLLLGLGSGVSISAGFGSFGFSVLLDGILLTSGQPLWLSQIIITLCFYLIAWFWARIPLGVGTLPALLLIGPAISLGATLTPDTQLFIGNLLAFSAGIVMFALGISLAAAAALGPDGITALSLAAEKKHGCSIAKANLLWNFLAIATGILLGGNFGPATIIGLFTVPLLIKFFIPRLRQFLETGLPAQTSAAIPRSVPNNHSPPPVFRAIHLNQLDHAATGPGGAKSRLKIPYSCYDIIL